MKTETWRERASCLGMDPNLFFPERGGKASDFAAEASRVCQTCPVKGACLDYAMETHQKFGMWGGLSPAERTARRRHGVQLMAVGL